MYVKCFECGANATHGLAGRGKDCSRVADSGRACRGIGEFRLCPECGAKNVKCRECGEKWIEW